MNKIMPCPVCGKDFQKRSGNHVRCFECSNAMQRVHKQKSIAKKRLAIAKNITVS